MRNIEASMSFEPSTISALLIKAHMDKVNDIANKYKMSTEDLHQLGMSFHIAIELSNKYDIPIKMGH